MSAVLTEQVANIFHHLTQGLCLHFDGRLLGIFARHNLSDRRLSEETKDIVNQGAGLIATHFRPCLVKSRDKVSPYVWV